MMQIGAGQTAIQRGIEVLEKQNCDARVLQIDDPKIKDPDEYVVKYGSGRYKLLVDNAISLVEFKIKMLKEGYNLENAKDKVAFLKKITNILANVDNKIEREVYIDKIAEQYDISKQAIYAEVNKILYKDKGKDKTILVKPVKKPEEVKTVEINDTIRKRENMVLYLLINNPQETLDIIKSNINVEDLKIKENQVVFEKIMSFNEKDSEKITKLISNIEDEKIQEHISEIMVTDYEITSVKKCIEDVVLVYNKERLQNRKAKIIEELKNTEISKERVKELESELNSIIINMAKIKS